jgi:hypothetical protein
MIAVTRGPYCTGAVTPSRAGTAGGDPAAAAARDQLMLDHPNRHRGQVEHLPPLHPNLRTDGQVRTTADTRARLIPHPLVRVGCANVDPGRPCCPPGLRPLLRRNDFGSGLTNGKSDDGDLDEFRLFCSNRRVNSAT